MTEDRPNDDHPELLLAGSDRPRPLPPHLRARLGEAFAEAATRPLSSEVRDRLESTLSSAPNAPGLTPTRWKWGPWAAFAGAAAAIAIVAGLVAPGLVRSPRSSTAAKSVAPSLPAAVPAGRAKHATSLGKSSPSRAVAPVFGAVAGNGAPRQPGGLVATPAAGARLSPPLAVASVTPSSGPTSGGNWVALKGTGFYRVEFVSFGASRASELQELSATKMRVVAPAHIPGTVYVQVHASTGASPASSPTRYTYIAP